MGSQAITTGWAHTQSFFLYLFIPNPISAALRADGFGETPFYHCLVAEILSAPGEPQGKNTPTLEVPSPISLKGLSPRCPEA